MKAKPDYKRYSLRWPAELHLLAEKAAAIKGHESLKSYLIELIESDARRTLADHGTIKLSNEEFDSFIRRADRDAETDTRSYLPTKR